MRRAVRGWTDEQFDAVLATVLRSGVLLTTVVVTLGAVVFLRAHGFERPAYGVFQGEPAGLRSIAGILGGVGRLGGRALIQFGLLLLIATPIVRVAISIAGFARQRDWLYVVITVAVLAVVGYSLLFGSA